MKPVFVYRLYGFDTIEDVLYQLNLKKVFLSKSVTPEIDSFSITIT